MTNHREGLVQVNVRVPEELHRRIVAAAERHEIPVNKLIAIWIEAQLSPGADVVLGKAHS